MLATLVALVRFPRRPVHTPIVTQFRVLIPSWRFFDGIGTAPSLWVRHASAPGAWGAWRSVIDVPPRTWRMLVWNPRGNLALACHGLLERLQQEMEEQPDAPPASLLAYTLVLHLARSAVPATDAPSMLQFRLVLHDGIDDAAGTVLLESEPHAC